MTSLEHELVPSPRELYITVDSSNGARPFAVGLVPAGESVVDVVRSKADAIGVPADLTPDLIAAAHRVITCVKEKTSNEESDTCLASREDALTSASDFARRLKQGHQAFHKPPNELDSLFTTAFKALVASDKLPLVLDQVGVLALSSSEVILKRTRSLAALRDRHTRESEAIMREDRSQAPIVAARHIEERETTRGQWDDLVSTLRETQRREFHDFIFRLYEQTHPEAQARIEEHKRNRGRGSRAPSRSTSRSPSRNSIVSTDASDETRFLGNPLRKSVSTDSSLAAAAMGGSRSSSGNSIIQSSPDTALNRQLVNELIDMGFTQEMAECALLLAENSRDEAATMLVERPEMVNEVLQEKAKSRQQKAAAREEAKNGSDAPPLGIFSRRRTRSFGAPSTSGPPSSSTSPAKESPQADATKPTKSALTAASSFMSTAVSNAIGKLGKVRMPNALTAALANVAGGSQQPEEANSPSTAGSPTARVALQESFAVQLGTQEKTSINFRLAVEPLLEDDTNDPTRQQAQRAHTLMSLYSSSIRGGVIIVPPDVLPSGTGLSKAFRQLCDKSTELHFIDLDDQLRDVCETLRAAGRDSLGIALINPGDYFVTRHSNLPLLHVAFHLVAEPKVTSELSNRSASIIGLRNIMRAAQKYDVAELSIPLLLLPEDGPIEESFTWCLRRAEMVFKAVKACLMEQQRATKTAVSSSRIITFLLPLSTTPEQFGAYRGCLTTVFRTT